MCTHRSPLYGHSLINIHLFISLLYVSLFSDSTSLLSTYSSSEFDTPNYDIEYHYILSIFCVHSAVIVFGSV